VEEKERSRPFLCPEIWYGRGETFKKRMRYSLLGLPKNESNLVEKAGKGGRGN